jgi:hypothetical protein
VIGKGPGYSILLTKHAISCILRTVFRNEVEIDRGGRLVELTMRAAADRHRVGFRGVEV